MKKSTEVTELIEALEVTASKRYLKASHMKQYEVQSVAFVQTDILRVARDLVVYSSMLDNRTNLEGESFLIEKLEFAIALLQNSQARIKAVNK